MTMLLSVLSRIESTHGIAFLFGNDDYRELATEVVKDDNRARMSDEFNAMSLDFEYHRISGYWFIGIEGSPVTPWQTPYEFAEDELYRKGSELFTEVKRLDTRAEIVLASHWGGWSVAPLSRLVSSDLQALRLSKPQHHREPL